MKQFLVDNELVILGTAREIKPVYKSILRGWNRDQHHIYPLHLNPPVFMDDRMYGISFEIDEDGIYTKMVIISGDTFAWWMADDDVVVEAIC